MSNALPRVIMLYLFLIPFSYVFAGWKEPRESLNNQVVIEDYRIFFAIGGRHSFILDRKLTKSEEDSLQQKLESLKQQLRNADDVYSKRLRLVSPLNSRRYSDVDAIHLHVMDIGKKNGSAGDAENRFNYRFFNNTELALTISLTPRWEPPNKTPEHEVFHLYQYGYTFFKNSWFLEGLAASMENHFSSGKWKSTALPRTKHDIDKLLTRSYSAKRFWNRLVLMCDPGCQKSDITCGYSLVRPLFEELVRQDLIAAKDRGLDAKDWPEREQKSKENNPYLLKGLDVTLTQNCPVSSSAELMDFVKLIREYKN